jgi:hypothetical protein
MLFLFFHKTQIGQFFSHLFTVLILIPSIVIKVRQAVVQQLFVIFLIAPYTLILLLKLLKFLS